MKILLCTGKLVDYGLDALYDGLCRVLGSENVLEYPHKPSLHGEKDVYFRWYPALFDYPITKTDEEKVEMLKNNEFDAILVGCISSGDFRRQQKASYKPNPLLNDFFELIREKSKTIPTYIVDTDDLSDINETLMKQLNYKLYFKREYSKNKTYPSSVVPLSFAYSEKYIPKNINNVRRNNVLWLGKSIESREKYLDFYSKLKDVKINNYFRQDDYRKHLLWYTIGLSLRGRGDDTVRYYEVSAHGMLLLSEKINIVIENDFKDGETAVFFDSVEELKEKLDYCLANPEYANKIAKAGREWLLKYHTTTARAQEMLEKMK